MDFEELVKMADDLVYSRENLSPQCTAGVVACALETDMGSIYTGINLDTHCGMGFCAEHSAISEMLKGNESRIAKLVAVAKEGIIPPCGRCRELIYQVNHDNLDAKIMIGDFTIKSLAELLPDLWWPKIQKDN